MSGERTYILGVPVDPLTTEEVHVAVEERLASRQPLQIATVNAEFVMRAQCDPEFRSVLERVDIATADGAGILWALRRRGVRLHARVGGSDLIWSIAEICERRHARVFLLGGSAGIAEAAARRLTNRYPKLAIAGTFAGSPAAGEVLHIVDLVRRSRTDVLFVAFGAPAQDIWIARHFASAGVIVGMGVGGSFDYLAGAAQRAPAWMQQHSLEWLWRLVRQPRRWRRMLALPHFAWLVWREPATQGGKTST